MYIGQKLSDGFILNIDDLLSKTEQYLGQKILVQGKVQDVCPMRGCWIEIKGQEFENVLRIKVTDGDIVFPLSSVGMDLIAEGDLVKLELSDRQAKLWKAHLAQEKGLELDTSEINLSPADLYELRLNTIAAKIF